MVGEVYISVVLALIHNHCEHLRHGVVSAFDAAIATEAVGACLDLTDGQGLKTAAKNYEQNCRPLSDKMRTGQPHKAMYLLATKYYVSTAPSAVFRIDR